MKITAKEFQRDNLVGTQWVGVVEDNTDPLFEGRCRIRVLGKMDQRVNLEDPNSEYVLPKDKLPWARAANATTGGSDTGGGCFDPPKLGTVVEVGFDNGNLYTPVYHHAVYISDEVKEEIQGSYENAHVLIYDTAFGQSISDNGEVSNDRDGEGIKVFFTEEKGFTIDYATGGGSTVFTIKPDNSVEVVNANGDSIVMTNDGNITFKHSGTVTINADADLEINCVNAKVSASADLEINCVNAKVNASAEAHIDSPKIKLGSNATQAIIKGDLFQSFFDAHIHPTPVGPSRPPVIKMEDIPILLSQVSSTE